MAATEERGGGGIEGSLSAGSRRWKLRWQPQAAHLRDVGSVETNDGDGMYSPQPSSAWLPNAAAWFLRHSL